MLLHLLEKVGGFFVFIGKIRRAQHPSQIEAGRVGETDKILDVQMTDDLVGGVLLINRNAREHFHPEYGHDVVIGGIIRNTGHVNPGHHDVLCNRVAEIKYIINDLLLASLDGAVLLSDFHVGFQLGLGELLLRIGIGSCQLHDPAGEMINNKDDRGHDGHQKPNDRSIPHGNRKRIGFGAVFRCDFAKENDQYG